MDRLIALADCNNFYASCERVFRPAWIGRPIVVLSNNDGCIIARSEEAKRAGVPMGAPYFKYKQTLDGIWAVVVSSNYCLYGDMSARVMATLAEFACGMEVYSIDEAWLDFSGFGDARAEERARAVVAATRKRTGIPISMGMGETKALAKLANRICKTEKTEGGVFNLAGRRDAEARMAEIDVGEVWGVGCRWAQALKTRGIRTALDLRNADPEAMRRRYNVVMQRLVLELRGVPCFESEAPEPKKQIICSRSFGDRRTEKKDLLEAVSTHAARAGEKLRAQGSVCGALQAAIRTGRHGKEYYGRSAVVRFDAPTSDTRKLAQAARECVEKIFAAGYRYAKAGVVLWEISPAAPLQQDLFCPPDDERSKALMRAMDALKSKHGKGKAFFLSEGAEKPWNMRRGMITPAYTTRWEELPRAG